MNANVIPVDNANIASISSRNMSDASSAQQLIASVTNAQTGAIDTRALAVLVHDAGHQDFSKASQAYVDIESTLAEQSPADAGRFTQDVKEQFQQPVPGGIWAVGQAAVIYGGKVLELNPILEKRWESTVSPITGQGGFSKGLSDLLRDNGINGYDLKPRSVPPGSVDQSDPRSNGIKNNINGAAAERAIAAEYEARGYNVDTQVSKQDGRRVVDVVADKAGSNAQHNIRVEVESKLGKVTLDGDVRRQIALDSQDLAQNRVARSAGNVLEGVGKVARPVGMIIDSVQLHSSYQADGNRVGDNTKRTASGIAGGAAFGAGGAWGFAAIGFSMGGPVGALIGGIIGGALGAWGGDAAGRAAYDAVSP